MVIKYGLYRFCTVAISCIVYDVHCCIPNFLLIVPYVSFIFHSNWMYNNQVEHQKLDELKWDNLFEILMKKFIIKQLYMYFTYLFNAFQGTVFPQKFGSTLTSNCHRKMAWQTCSNCLNYKEIGNIQLPKSHQLHNCCTCCLVKLSVFSVIFRCSALFWQYLLTYLGVL